MKKIEIGTWIKQPKINPILLSFSTAKTPLQVEKETGIKRPKIKYYLERGLLISLNPNAKKGRLYTLTSYARKLLNLPRIKKRDNKDWELTGRMNSSPRQKIVILKVLNFLGVPYDMEKIELKYTSGKISKRAWSLKLNSCVTRNSTYSILNELLEEGLVVTRKMGEFRKEFRGEYLYWKRKRRYYWISEKGKKFVEEKGF